MIGIPALHRLLDAFRDGATTPLALRKLVFPSVPTFEASLDENAHRIRAEDAFTAPTPVR